MKWKVLRLFLPLLVAGFVLPLVVLGPDGEPVMTLSDWKPPPAVVDGLSGLAAKISRASEEGPAVVLEPERIYRWQDERGMWHFSNDASEVPAHALVEEIPLVVNELPAPESVDPPGLPEVGELVEGAEEIRRLSDERLQTLEQL